MSEIIINKVTKQYNKQGGIKDIQLTLPDGKLIAIVGPSGCGKTTLLRTIAGFLNPDTGNILFGDKDVTNTTPQQRNASMVFQQYALWPHMTVFDNVAYGLKLKKESKATIEEKVENILRIVEIDTNDIKKRHPQEYSGGQQQRIALARALVVKPDVLLMDEPLSNLDAKVRQKLRLEIKRIQVESGITTIYVTHDQEEALSMADIVVIMNQGNIIQVGSPKEVYQQPNSEFVAQFLGESHRLTLDDEHGKTKNVIIRAEDIKLLSPTQKVNMDDKQWYLTQATIIDDLYLGANQRYLIDINGQEIFANSLDHYQSGDTCLVAIPKEKMHEF